LSGTINPIQGTVNDLKLMFKAYAWPNKVRPKVFESAEVQGANVVPDRSIMIEIGILRGVERSSGALANRPVMQAHIVVFAYSPTEVKKIMDDIFTCIFKTLDGDSPTQRLWYISRRFSHIEKIVPAQMFMRPIVREPIRQEFMRQDLFLGIYVKP
jgi:hypothetical protein